MVGAWVFCWEADPQRAEVGSQPASCLHHRYEDEINKRTNAENDFVVMKKVMERGSSGS